MKIFHVTYRGDVGGVELYAKRACQYLKEDNDVTFVMTGKAMSDPLIPELSRMGIKYNVLGCNSGHDPRLFYRFLSLVWRERPDVVHFNVLPFLCRFAIWLMPRKTRVVSTIHCPISKKYPMWVRMLSSRIDCFCPVSRSTQQGLLAAYPDAKSMVLYNPIDVRGLPEKDGAGLRRILNVDAAAPIMGMVARFNPPKMWKEFLDVTLRVLSQDLHFHSVAIGDGPQLVEMKDYWGRITAGRSDLKERLHWLGLRRDAVALVGGMDVFLFLSWSEEMPTTLLEAFAMRTPVVGNVPRGGVGEIFKCAGAGKQLGVFCADSDIEKLADAVIGVVRDRGAAKLYVENAYRVICEHFDAARVFSGTLLNLYKHITGSRE